MIGYLVPQASSYAAHIDWLFALILVTVGFWFVVAEVAFLWLCVRFRRRPGVPARYVAGTSKEEKRWISWPHYAVIACDVVLIVATVYVWIEVKQSMPPPDEHVRIVAQQWAWVFVHAGPDAKLGTADDIVTVDELHVRVDRVYQFELVSTDTLHSFSVPAFRLKQDAVPGRTIRGWFKPTQRGRFDIQCAEICGIGHALMPGTVVIESPQEHEAWMRERST
jgi:cytochrome c oxidase subunit 2